MRRRFIQIPAILLLLGGVAAQAEETDPEAAGGLCAGAQGACQTIEGSGEAAAGQGALGVFVIQIGERNTARVVQPARAHATIVQHGDDNTAGVRQAGDGGYASLSQAGDDNLSLVDQSGAADNSVVAVQSGDQNIASIRQHALAGLNAAQVNQQGVGHEVTLIQDGSENDAVLSQSGAGNRMTLAQYGDGNGATWTQDGTNLPDLNVTQTGAMAITITQSGP